MLRDQSVKCFDIDYRIQRYFEVIGVKKSFCVDTHPPPPQY